MAVILILGSSCRYRAWFLTGHRWVLLCDLGVGDPCSGHAWADRGKVALQMQPFLKFVGTSCQVLFAD